MVEFALNRTQPAPFNKRAFYALLNGKVFDSRSKIEVVNELRRNLDGKTVPQVSGFSFNQDHPILRRYLEVGFRQGLPDRQDELDQALAHKIDKALDSSPSNEKKQQEGWEWVKYRIVLESLRRYIGTPTALRGLEARNSSKKEPEGHVLFRRLESLVKVLVEAERVVSEWKGKIVFVYLPQYERYFGNISDLPRPEVLRRVKRIGIQIVDISEAVFKKLETPTNM
jgi:hypothetical protein